MGNIENILIVGAGSCVGGIARYAVSRVIASSAHSAFPWGTLAVNVAGCFIIGLVYGYIDRGGYMSDWLRLFLTVGFCGGFTTFSTFMHENFLLFGSPDYMLLAAYAVVSILAGFGMLYLGFAAMRVF